MTLAAIDVEPALYCGTYAKYNDGSIAGKWLKLRDYTDADEFMQACRDLHPNEADPEFMFQDFEGFPKDLYGESLAPSDLEKIYEWVKLDDDDKELVEEYSDATGYSLGQYDDLEAIRDKHYCTLDFGSYGDENTAMGNYVEDEGLIDIPDGLRGYINYEALGRDWLMDKNVSSNGYVFEA